MRLGAREGFVPAHPYDKESRGDCGRKTEQGVSAVRRVYSLGYRAFRENAVLLLFCAAMMETIDIFLSGSSRLGPKVFIYAAVAHQLHQTVLIAEQYLASSGRTTSSFSFKFFLLYAGLLLPVGVCFFVVMNVDLQPGLDEASFQMRVLFSGSIAFLLWILLMAIFGPAFAAIVAGEEWAISDTLANIRQHLWPVLWRGFLGSGVVSILLIAIFIALSGLGLPNSGRQDDQSISLTGATVSAVQYFFFFYATALWVAAMSIPYMERVGPPPSRVASTFE